MIPGKFENVANRRVLEAGTDGELHILDIETLGEGEGGINVMVSTWYPSEDDIRRMIAGKPLQLHIVGTKHPWVSVLVGE